MRKMRRFLCVGVALIMIILAVTGCQASKENSQTTMDSTEKLTSDERNTGEQSSEEQTSDVQTSDKTDGEKETNTTIEGQTLLAEDKLGTASLDGIKKVCIDPGHQGKGNNDLEPVGPGSEETKKKVSYGTSGVATGIAEYQLNLDVALLLRAELEKRGYEVVMTRETNEVDISNVERAKLGNASGADVAVRIHANGSENSSAQGALTIYPSSKNPYVAYLSDASKLLSESILTSLCEETGARNRGANASDAYSGSNWSTIPVTIVEMGFMSNPDEDKLMATDAYREKLVKGIADGIDVYFANIEAY